jgi:hypothetical protein
MKMMKSLLLGTAAGLVAVAAAQAADLENDKAPTKAADYVKVCSLYGEGFYQIPGEGDICIRIGATARLDGGFNADGNGGPFIGSGADSRNNRIDTRDFLFQGRGTIWFDARQMTQYGVLKAYFSGGFDASTGTSTTGNAFWKRGYIGFAGATVGKTQSFFDFLNGAFSYGAYHLGGGSNTYDSGTLLAAYTAEFGLGISATASIEDSSTRRNALWDAGTNALAIGSFPGPSGTSLIGSTVCNAQSVAADGPPPPTPPATAITGCPIGDYAANQIPDLVANLRVDQGWGSGQIAGALHQVRAGSYGNNVSALAPNIGPGEVTGQAPADKWGFALMGGVMVNVPTGESDRVWANVVYAQGAMAYTGLSQFGSFGTFSRFNGGSVGAAWALDGVFANTVGPAGAGLAASGIQLTKAWSVGAAFEHHWSPMLRSSVFGVVTDVSYPGDLNSGAKAIFCSSPVGPVRTAAGAAPNFATGAVLGCNPDFIVWGIGTRTVWNPVRNLDLGAEIMYSRLDQNMGAGVLLNFGGAGGTPAGNYTPQNESIWSGLLRAQWHFGAPPTEEGRS